MTKLFLNSVFYIYILTSNLTENLIEKNVHFQMYNAQDKFGNSGENTGYNFDFNVKNLKENFEFSKNDIINFAILAKNAYITRHSPDWENLPPIDNTFPIDPRKDTIKGYIFSDARFENVVISLKGTSLGILSNDSYNDKFNDNLFYSCNPFIEYPKLYQCKNPNETINCYKKSLNYPLNYLNILDKYYNVINNILKLNDTNKNVILTGHSLGGILTTYLGLKYNYPVITFLTPGEKQYLTSAMTKENLHSNLNNIFHFTHNADPISHGHCNLWCKLSGYSIKTKCHLGKICMYDLKTLGYRDSIFYHKLDFFINIIKQYNLPNCSFVNCNETRCDKN